VAPTETGDPFIYNGWGPAEDSKYDGYTAQTADGKYSVTGAHSGPTIATPNSFPMNQGSPCYNAWVALCIDDGTGPACVDASGDATSSNATAAMTTNGYYYAASRGMGFYILIFVIIFIVVLAIGGGGYYYYRHRNT
jgi:hypothetical protein